MIPGFYPEATLRTPGWGTATRGKALVLSIETKQLAQVTLSAVRKLSISPLTLTQYFGYSYLLTVKRRRMVGMLAFRSMADTPQPVGQNAALLLTRG